MRLGERCRPARRDQLAHRGRDLGAEPLDGRRVVAADDERADAVGERELGEPLGPRGVVGGRRRCRAAARRPGRGRRRPRRRRCGRCARRASPAARRTGWAASRRRAGRSARASSARSRRSRSRRRAPVPGRGARRRPGSARPRPAPSARRCPRRRGSPRCRPRARAAPRPAYDGGRPRPRSRPRTPPAPRPSSTRPRLSTSRLATVVASTNGGRSGRLVTLVVTRSDDVRASTVAISGPGVEEPRLVRVVLERRQLQAGGLGEQRQLDDPVGLRGVRGDERAELEVVPVVGHPHVLR